MKSILAGISISIGAIAFLSCDNTFIGASLFSIGLLMVCTFNLNLYTGKVCYLNRGVSLKQVIHTWFGNLIGTVLIGTLLRMTRLSSLSIRATEICDIKLNDSLLSIFILSMLCNIMIYVGVENFKNNPHYYGKYISLYLGVVVFIVCGFEHCVANMFYFTLAGVWSIETIKYLLVMTLGNAVGGIAFTRLRKMYI